MRSIGSALARIFMTPHCSILQIENVWMTGDPSVLFDAGRP